MKRSTVVLLGCFVGLSGLVAGCTFEYSEFDFAEAEEEAAEPRDRNDAMDAGADPERREFAAGGAAAE